MQRKRKEVEGNERSKNKVRQRKAKRGKKRKKNNEGKP